MGTITGTPDSRVRIVVAQYYKGLYGDFSDRYLACVQTSPLPQKKKRGKKRRLLSRFFSAGGGTSVHRLSLFRGQKW